MSTLAASLTLHRAVGAIRATKRLPLSPVIATAILIAFFGGAALAPYIAPYDRQHQNLSEARIPPVLFDPSSTWKHPLGTDQLGRDELSRLIWGAQITALVIPLSLLTVIVVGTASGLLAAYSGGVVDLILMRLVDVQLSIPPLILAIALVYAIGPGFSGIVIVLVVWSWARFARIIRSDVLTQRDREYVLAAAAIGCSPWRVMVRHILPNIANTVLVLATLDIGRFVVFEAGLSFLGLGVKKPSAAWGSMLAEGRAFVVDAWWLAMIPGLAILLVSLAGNLLGDFLTDALDPRQRGAKYASTY
jgi:peptide/nickel transport system permease protein